MLPVRTYRNWKFNNIKQMAAAKIQNKRSEAVMTAVRLSALLFLFF